MKKRVFIIISLLLLAVFWLWIGFRSRAGVEQVFRDGIYEVIGWEPLTIEINGTGKVRDYDQEIMYARMDGFVKEIFLKEKQLVDVHTLVLLLENQSKHTQLNALEYQRDLKAKELERLTVQLGQYVIQREEIDLELKELEQVSEQLQKEFKLKETLYKNGGLSEQAKDEVMLQIESNNILVDKAHLRLKRLDVETSIHKNLITVARLDLAHLQKQCDELKIDLAKLQVKTEKAGVLSELYVEEGQWIPVGREIGRLSSPEEKLAEIWINEFDIPYVEIGKQVVLRPEYDPTIQVVGEVVNIDENPELKNGLTLFKIEIRFVNKNNFYSGLTVNAQIFHQVRISTLTLPIDALMEERTDETIERYVFVVDGDRVARQVVRTGLIQSGRVEIIEGLRPGQKIITGPYEYLQSLKQAGR